MLRVLAFLCGIAFILAGVAGMSLKPEYIVDGKLFGKFLVNFEHNLVHLVTGILALVSGVKSYFASKLFFIIFGIIYGILAILGIVQTDADFFHQHILVDDFGNYVHIAISLLFLVFGFLFRK